MRPTTLSSNFRITVPKEVRDTLGLAPGQKLLFIDTGSAVKLMRQPTMTELVGIGRGANVEGTRERAERMNCDAHFAGLPSVDYHPKRAAP